MANYKTLNLEIGYPDVYTALKILSNEKITAKKLGYKAIKVIHGYGSSGKGGKIKSAVIRELSKEKEEGKIKHFVKGEEFSCFCENGREAIKLCPDLKSDSDYCRENDGVTIIILK